MKGRTKTTAKEIMNKVFYEKSSSTILTFSHHIEDAVLEAMKKYATVKCAELLSIVAEKAKVYKSEGGCENWIDKDFILEAVDLEKFCS